MGTKSSKESGTQSLSEQQVDTLYKYRVMDNISCKFWNIEDLTNSIIKRLNRYIGDLVQSGFLIQLNPGNYRFNVEKCLYIVKQNLDQIMKELTNQQRMELLGNLTFKLQPPESKSESSICEIISKFTLEKFNFCVILLDNLKLCQRHINEYNNFRLKMPNETLLKKFKKKYNSDDLHHILDTEDNTLKTYLGSLAKYESLLTKLLATESHDELEAVKNEIDQSICSKYEQSLF